ncbi:uncharacterized protein CANTADRAFT_26517 [Suhomyces tanzawaensis NRRL Y-17324]|uniref:Uncharacterized protein n=1 Tax=Suhomyces tanzawaensis NRRL Y-17324 TaxID=984487 RepID=A0A1E4SFV1_9ASCO|nr:uncharacterized protein CANTADRAFT_26517 [Suhomyces tanzawaensis NRRL Y-17324]ODV78394.1 hypothetical protein CANTADRAFT_26517 [Suhomyces tanzawaensis NRRL Y-17324]
MLEGRISGSNSATGAERRESHTTMLLVSTSPSERPSRPGGLFLRCWWNGLRIFSNAWVETRTDKA